MEQLRKFIDRDINLENIKNSGQLKDFGITCTYLPDPPEDFDEFEFRTGLDSLDNIAVIITVEMGKIKKVMFGLADRENPDVIRSLPESQLHGLLAEKGGRLAGFFEYISAPGS